MSCLMTEQVKSVEAPDCEVWEGEIMSLIACLCFLTELNFALLCKYETLQEQIRSGTPPVFLLWNHVLEQHRFAGWLDDCLHFLV